MKSNKKSFFFFRLIEIYERKETRTKREGRHIPKPSQAKKLSKKLGTKRHPQQIVEMKRKKTRKPKGKEKEQEMKHTQSKFMSQSGNLHLERML